MMCAKLLKHRKEGEKGRFYDVTEDYYNRVIAFYGRTVKWVLKHQTATLLVTFGTLVLTLILYVVVPKGFFPVQDTGVILGISEAPDDVSFTAMSQRQQELAKVILKNKDVDSLSSFIGVDGTNTTPNSGRIQINLKPRDERNEDASAIIRRLQPELAKVDGITLYMQPVQDLTVEDRVSRTQFQYSIEDADAQELAQWTPKLVQKLRARRNCATWPRTSSMAASGRHHHRPRYGVAAGNPSAGHRQHVVRRLRAAPGFHHLYAAESISRGAGSPAEFRETPDAMNDIYVRPSSTTPASGAPTANAATSTTSGPPVPLSAFMRMQTDERASRGQSPRAVSGCDPVVQPCSQSLFGRCHAGHSGSGKRNSDAGEHPRLISRNGRRIPELAGERAVSDSGRHHHGVHCAGSFV